MSKGTSFNELSLVLMRYPCFTPPLTPIARGEGGQVVLLASRTSTLGIPAKPQ